MKDISMKVAKQKVQAKPKVKSPAQTTAPKQGVFSKIKNFFVKASTAIKNLFIGRVDFVKATSTAKKARNILSDKKITALTGGIVVVAAAYAVVVPAYTAYILLLLSLHYYRLLIFKAAVTAVACVSLVADVSYATTENLKRSMSHVSKTTLYALRQARRNVLKFISSGVAAAFKSRKAKNLGD